MIKNSIGNRSVLFGLIDFNRNHNRNPELPLNIFNKFNFKNYNQISGNNASIFFKNIDFKSVEKNIDEKQISYDDVCTIFFGKIYSLEKMNFKLNDFKINKAISRNFVKNGSKSLNQLNGNFCGFIFDKEKNIVTFFRDRYGVETIYFSKNDNVIIFSTDISYFNNIKGCNKISKQAAAQFLHFSYVPTPLTIFKSVNSLLPGHVISLDKNIIQDQIEYSDLMFINGNTNKNGNLSLDANLNSFENLLSDSIKKRILGESKICLLFSGGKDSTAIAIALSKMKLKNLEAVTIANDEMSSHTQRSIKICKYLGIKQHIINLDNIDTSAYFEKLIKYSGQPIGDPAAIPLMAVMNHISDNFDVFIDGTGNDYYFGFLKKWGFKAYSLRLKFERVFSKKLWSFFVKILSIFINSSNSILNKWNKDIEETFVTWQGWDKFEIKNVFNVNIDLAKTFLWAEMNSYINNNSDVINVQTGVYGKIWEPHAATRKGKIVVNQIFKKEIIYPFTDKNIYDFINTLPDELKYNLDGQNKMLIRHYLKRELPEEFLETEKGDLVFNTNFLVKTSDFSIGGKIIENMKNVFSSIDNRKLINIFKKEVVSGLSNQKIYNLIILSNWISYIMNDSE